MVKKTIHLRPGDLVRFAWLGQVKLYRYHARRRSADYPVYLVRLDPVDESSGHLETALESLELAVTADQLWSWVGMMTDARPYVAKSTVPNRPLVRTT